MYARGAAVRWWLRRCEMNASQTRCVGTRRRGDFVLMRPLVRILLATDSEDRTQMGSVWNQTIPAHALLGEGTRARRWGRATHHLAMHSTLVPLHARWSPRGRTTSCDASPRSSERSTRPGASEVHRTAHGEGALGSPSPNRRARLCARRRLFGASPRRRPVRIVMG